MRARHGLLHWVSGLLIVAVAGLVLLGVHFHGHIPVLKAAAFSPDGQAVDPLRKAARGANVVICVIDTGRADHLGCYGYPRDTTPNIDALAAKSLKFDDHFCQYPKTKASTVSLFTSQYSDTSLVSEDRAMPPKTFTMASGLEAAGFHTALFSSNPNSSPGMGIGLDFEERYDQTNVKPIVRKWDLLTKPEPLLQLFDGWLAKQRHSRFFAYVHLDPPHQPYIQPEEMTALFRGKTPPSFRAGRYEFPVGEKKTVQPYPNAPLREWINLYDANLRYADWAVGELQRMLQKAGVFDNTLLIVTADHGEALGEHKYQWHATCPYDEAIHIPLLVKFPNRKGPTGRVDALTETVDIFPTILDLYGISWPPSTIQGKSLVRLVSGEADRAHDYTFARTNGEWPCYVVRDRQWALLLYQGGTMRALYDLTADPRQTHNVVRERPQQAAKLLKVFTAFAQTQKYLPLDFVDPKFKPLTAPGSPDTAMTEETRRKLRTLGYMD